MKEIEKAFIIDDMNAFQNSIFLLGVMFTEVKEVQENIYLGTPDFKLLKDNKFFRFRYCYYPKSVFFPDDPLQFMNGEITFSDRSIDSQAHELRKQVGFKVNSKEILDKMITILTRLGFVHTVILKKNRTTYYQWLQDKRGKEIVYKRSAVHIEVDSGIKISKYPKHVIHELENTAQICVELLDEQDETEAYNLVDDLVSQLNLRQDKVTELGYFSRLLLKEPLIEDDTNGSMEK